MREGFSDLTSFQSGGSPESICLKLRQAGLPLVHACAIEGALVRAAALEQWLRQTSIDASHARDQDPTCGGGTSASSASKGWWSAWLPSAPLQRSTQPPPPPPPPPQPLQARPPAGSATSPPGSTAPAVAATAMATYHAAASTAPTAERHAVLDDAAHSVPIAATLNASTCRRRHVHRPAVGQE
ncbi:hypothetical protein HYH02_005254 [Chlamydomonas schloesseri]|uniref:Uncharacterized protein n=1 Tax=Chlamydomonas schloesseri TaxID=2026947 RepID=A0A835WLC6_9CHLO|nr:hypothetical protein HYH02_005254 [Chlamydomonas schloesseri]|eukprot:KAG2449727.1 hypothetical protein HYH02_005254 [Chlamydomonas schloesseri]